MESTLKRLLQVETQAEALIAKTQVEREQFIQQALQETQQVEQQFKATLPQLKTHFLEKAEHRATQTLAELNKRYAERKDRLCQLADDNQQRALDAALQVLLRVGQTE